MKSTLRCRRNRNDAIFCSTAGCPCSGLCYLRLYASYCDVLIWGGNFHAVENGTVYRSAQLSKTQFAHAIDTHHIRSVLNLRGPNLDEAWYRDELAVTQGRGASHDDVGISADREVTPDKIAKILAVLRDAPKPSLVHCLSGADRSGFVSALDEYVVRGKSAEMAAKELSFRYGHFPYLTSKTGAMDNSFDEWVRLYQR
jgi:protein tyrosine/serine phosphatase